MQFDPGSLQPNNIFQIVIFRFFTIDFEILLTSLPDNKILDWSKFLAISDNNLNVAKRLIPVFDRIGNILGKGGNAVTGLSSISKNVLLVIVYTNEY